MSALNCNTCAASYCVAGAVGIYHYQLGLATPLIPP